MPTATFFSMGSRIKVVLENEGRVSDSRLSRVPGWFEEWESVLSRFRPDSELNRLHRSGAKRHRISPILGAVLEESLRAAGLTEGLVTPLVHDAVRAAGYDRPFGEMDTLGSKKPSRMNHIPDWRVIRWDRKNRLLRLPAEARLDFGGIAKGWAADRASARLGRHGSALVDAGGDISASGPRADGSPWPVGVANPFAAGELLCTLALSHGGVATSGRDYRKWIQSGKPRHHIIDPRTGEPARTDVLTATVIARDARRAEAAAKAALILGSQCGIEWLERHFGLAGMLVLEDWRILCSRRFTDFVWR